MRDTEGPAIRQAVPDIGCDRDRAPDEQRLEADLGDEPRLELTGREHQPVGARRRDRQQQDRHGQRAHGATLACAIALLALLGGCIQDIADIDNVFYNGDRRKVHCAVNLDSAANNSLDSIDTGLDRAAARGEIVELYAHRPGVTVPVATIEHVVAGAQARGLRFVTYTELAREDVRGPGIALSFDDRFIAEWDAIRPMLRTYGARATFFVTRYSRLDEERRAQLARFRSEDGHDLQAHGENHLRAPAFVEEHGLDAYLAEEAIPSIESMRADGYDITAFAYPYGARTHELDVALLRHVEVLRSVSFSWSWPVQDACP